MTTEQPKCPHCHEEIELSLALDAMEPHRFSVAIMAEEGRMFNLATVGAFLTNISKLMTSLTREIGHKHTVFLEGIETLPGEFRFHIITAAIIKEKQNDKNTGLYSVGC